jgi:hypothetical protein
MNKIILGHNPLFGINHNSQKEGMRKALYYRDISNLKNFLFLAKECGYDDIMVSTHPGALKLLNEIRNSDIGTSLNVYPILPYMQKYVRASNEAGILKMVMNLLNNSGAIKGLTLIAKVGLSGVFSNIDQLIRSALQIEFDNFKKFKCERVFLHNALTDLAIGLDMKRPIEIFLDFVNRELGAKAGFGTLNLPYAIEKFNDWNIKEKYFMAPFNKSGHQMNPNLKNNITTLSENPDVKVLAMSSLASGTINVDEAFSFLKTINNIDSIVVGISNPKHLSSTMESFKKNK